MTLREASLNGLMVIDIIPWALFGWGTCPPHVFGGGGQKALCPPHVLEGKIFLFSAWIEIKNKELPDS